MKKLFVSILLAVLFSACRSNVRKTTKDSLNRPDATDVSSSETPALIKKFKPILRGFWIKADYAEKIKKTKSLAEASDLATWITAFYINTDKIIGDSIKFIAGYENHDSGDVTISFRRGNKPEAILFDGQDLNYSVKNGDTVLILPQYDKQKKQYVETRFIRSQKNNPDDDLSYGLRLYINKNLIAGEYKLIDSTSIPLKVSFSEDGKVNGFEKFKSYSINFDLNTDVNDNLDKILFSDGNNHHSSYSFKIIADTLKLYETKEAADSISLILGQLKYKLVRQK